MTSPFRSDFPVFVQRPELHYLDAAATAQRPQAVLDAVRRFQEHDTANVHRGIYQLAEDATAAYESARQSVADFLHAPTAKEVVFTSGTTMGMNLLAATWGETQLAKGDRIVLSALEHHAVIVPWTELARRKGVEIDVIPLRDDGLLDLDRYEAFLTPATKLVCVTAMSNVTGAAVDLARVVRAAKRVGARVFVDAAQLVCHRAVDVQELQVDALVFSGTKAYGDFGSGVLWGSLDLLSDLPPFHRGGHMIREVRWDAVSYDDVPGRFEAGTPNVTGAVALAAGLAYLQDAWKRSGREHEYRMLEELHERLSEFDGITIHGPVVSAERGPIVAFSVDGAHPHDIAQVLDGHGVAVRAGHHCAMPLHEALGVPATVRASIGLWSDRSDIDALVSGLEEVRATFGS